jgi:class 3 adenylate cyclase/tetratricopeptide (TPR) repeat protein
VTKQVKKRPGGALLPYLPSVQAAWLAAQPARSWQELDGTLVFADVSGFTPLTERLAKRGKVGAEELTDILNAVYRELLAVATAFGGDCLKFGGDALLLLFTGQDHPRRAGAAAAGMLDGLRPFRRLRTESGTASLNMSIGVHTGPCLLFLAGLSHRELVVAGPTVTETLAMEAAAGSGQILVSAATAAFLEPSDLGQPSGAGWLLRRAPEAALLPPGGSAIPENFDASPGIPVALSRYLVSGPQEGEHRLATIGFLQFGQTDDTLVEAGPAKLAGLLEDLLSQVDEACAEHGVTFLASDVDKGAGKLILATGTPSASPDDEDRLLLGLRTILDGSSGLPVRAGVNRGRIFSVDLGSPDRRCFTVMGDAVNLAARIMGHATWGQLLAADDVLGRVRTRFETIPLEPFTVKGKSQPVRAHVIGEARGHRTPEAGADLPLIGRREELGVIREALATAHEGDGRVVELVGEPGIGKSRLMAAVMALPHGLPVFAVEAGRYSLATPYFALRRSLRRMVGVLADAPTEDVEPALSRTVQWLAPHLAPWLPLIGIPLGLELPDTPETASLDQSFRRAKLQAVVIELMGRILDGPALLTVEDAHWLDAASVDLLEELVAGVGRRPWVVLITRRPVEGGLELGDRAQLSRIRLEPLAAEAAVSLASAATQGASLPPGALGELVERSGGNPLFLEELVAAAVSGGLTELPDTVEAVLAAAIDTLGPSDRSLLRQAAVLGSKFPVEVFASMLGETPASVRRDLRGLQRFLQRDPMGMVRFRHVLVRDVAYEGLAFRARRELHGRAGVILEEGAGDHTEEIAELLSIHFHAAARYRESWRYSRTAGERAQHSAAPIEAAAFYARALEAARHLPDLDAAESSSVAELLGDVNELSGRYELASTAYRQSRKLARGDQLHQARLCRKLGYIRDRQGRYSEASRWFRRGLRELDLAPAGPEHDQRQARLMTAFGSTRLRQGRYREAIPMLEDGARLAESSSELDALAHALQLSDAAYIELGVFEHVSARERALAIYEELGDALGQANTLNQMGIVAYWQGEWDQAVAMYERSGVAGRRAGALVELAMWINNIAEIRSDQGRIGEAEQLFQEALDIWQGGGRRLGTAWAMSNLGRAAARDGRFDEATERLEDARRLLKEMGAEGLLLETEARQVECLIFAGEHGPALELAERLHGPALRLGSTSYVVAMLERLAGYALAQSGQARRGWGRLGLSLLRSQDSGIRYEAALSLHALGRVSRLLGAPGADDLMAEAQSIFDGLGVVGIPAVPLPGPS